MNEICRIYQLISLSVSLLFLVGEKEEEREESIYLREAKNIRIVILTRWIWANIAPSSDLTSHCF